MVVASTWFDCATSARLCSGCRPRLVHMSPNWTSRSSAATRPGNCCASAAARLVDDGRLAGAALGRHHDDDLARLHGRGRGQVTVGAALTETGIPARRSATSSWSAAGA